jgi:ketosteroid isomerase-like protein
MFSRITAMASAALIVSTACAHQPTLQTEGEYRRLEARQNSFLEGLSSRDLERTTGHFSDDATLHVANMPALHGREAIGRFYGNVFRFMRESTAVPEMIEMSRSGDLAYSTGKVSNAFESEEGRIRYSGKYLLVWKRVAGEWLIAHYGISNDHPEPSRQDGR